MMYIIELPPQCYDKTISIKCPFPICIHFRDYTSHSVTMSAFQVNAILQPTTAICQDQNLPYQTQKAKQSRVLKLVGCLAETDHLKPQ